GTGGTMSLGFKTLPMVFAQMPGGALFGGAFFLILFLAAITSSLSMLQPTKAFFEESLGVGRQISTTMVTAWGLVGNLFVLWYSRELIALDTIDFWVGTFFILVVAGVQIVAFGWVFGVDKGLEEAHQGANIRIPQVFRFIMKYVSPTFLLVVVVGFCINNVPGYLDTLFGDATAVLTAKNGAAPSAEQVAAFEANASDAGLTWILMLATIAGLVTITALGARRWRAQGLDLDGQRPLED
ncbi:MAG: sodium:calcium symporter, partial [Planctomycetes bacterium]|nr:sodium:calcium symporter [Planctomycetota bacterium]